jgi:hypothetical protein
VEGQAEQGQGTNQKSPSSPSPWEFEKRVQTWTVTEYGRRPNVWRYAIGPHVAEEKWVRKAKQGAVMPEKIAEDLILCYSGPDHLVFDPFCGRARCDHHKSVNQAAPVAAPDAVGGSEERKSCAPEAFAALPPPAR